MSNVFIGAIGLSLFAVPVAGQLSSQAADSSPIPADVQRAVAELPDGRMQRPGSLDAMTPAQVKYVEGILDGPRNAISGPLVVMLQSPELGDLAQRTMAYARYAGTQGFASVPPRLNEIAVIMAAREWSSPYVWNAHHRYAVSVGVPAELVEAIRTGSAAPENLQPDVAAVYAFLDELLQTRQVSDATFAAARNALGGDRQVVDLIGTFAIYQMSAMLTAVDRTGLADGQQPALRPLE
ncbi:MAG TPA: carboxymuconolactone decarboxylase family protein [Gammaproteobacteria bacterium]|nr:carboxymuconolactone decarboxylase family protein [Gammaproteobacteria bacterium]